MARIITRFAIGVVGLAGALALGPVAAQSTDGYHAIQVFPIVVDTASFSQRFTFRNPYDEEVPLSATFYPAKGTAQSMPLACPGFKVPPLRQATFASLREICPALAQGSAFGALVVRASVPYAFAAFSRVHNPAGNGFSVEAFAAHTFTSATSVVTGLRRMAATPNSPAFQSNCFVGNLGAMTPTQTPQPTSVEVSVRNADGLLVGTHTVSLLPGELVRLLDVFAAVGNVADEFNDATATFKNTSGTQPGLLGFCTVQDNTSFGADFRIAKQELAFGGVVGSQDHTTNRNLPIYYDVDDGRSRRFTIPPGASRNVHLLYFRHPDIVSCDVYGIFTGARGSPTNGLEMRLLVEDYETFELRVIAGGDMTTYFSNLYLGDKDAHGGGANTRYFLEVESNGIAEDKYRAYHLLCFSGSGTTLADMVQTGLPLAF